MDDRYDSPHARWPRLAIRTARRRTQPVTSPVDLGSVPTDGKEIDVTAAG